ncbi:hypothetical protein KIN20_014261 [Parelaphostrongylus tenuis]|uniref:Uncharacterized protein n=1 Tax=Parelaphostrongylus tenuis TaxID=148309 RepID=A0AAD5QPA0_PARTN|nr:hypothetical protein KIN20_014261 [Parelaphostrongylus tenuis]
MGMLNIHIFPAPAPAAAACAIDRHVVSDCLAKDYAGHFLHTVGAIRRTEDSVVAKHDSDGSK